MQRSLNCLIKNVWNILTNNNNKKCISIKQSTEFELIVTSKIYTKFHVNIHRKDGFWVVAEIDWKYILWNFSNMNLQGTLSFRYNVFQVNFECKRCYSPQARSTSIEYLHAKHFQHPSDKTFRFTFSHFQR